MATIIAQELPDIKSVIVMSGFISPRPKNYELRKLAIPSLHIMGKPDVFISNDKSRELARLYEESKIVVHEKGHTIIQNSAVKNEIIDFLRNYS